MRDIVGLLMAILNYRSKLSCLRRVV